MRCWRSQSILESLSGKQFANVGKPYLYRSMYQWVLENGLPFDPQPLTKREWELVEKHVTHNMPQQCFANCQESILGPLFLQITDIARGRMGVISPFDYVEGYVISTEVPIPIHHAWLLLRGKVVDPTLRSRRKSPSTTTRCCKNGSDRVQENQGGVAHEERR